MPYLLVIVALILLVVLHELGHFLAARAVGIRATKFYVFFPPAAYKKQVGDVEYGIGWIPAGGFVKLPGMFEPEPAQVGERVKWEIGKLGELPPDAALQVDAAQRRIAKAQGSAELVEPLREIEEVAAARRADPAVAASKETSADVAKAHSRIVELLDDLHPKAYWRAALWRRMTVIFAGPAVNLIVAFVVLTGFYWGFVPKYETDGPLRVAEVQEGSPAEEAGLTEESRIYAWNGPVDGTNPGELIDRIGAGLGKPVEMTFAEPGEERVTKTIEPARIGDEEDERIGVLLPTGDSDRALKVAVVGRSTTDPITAMRVTLEEMRYITWGNLTRLPQVFFKEEIRKDVGSVVGIVQVAEQVDQAGTIIRYVGIISLILAVMNLLPLLPLDGGHLLFGIIEAVRRRPLPRMVFERYSMVGLALVLVLFAIGLNNDIGRAG